MTNFNPTKLAKDEADKKAKDFAESAAEYEAKAPEHEKQALNYECELFGKVIEAYMSYAILRNYDDLEWKDVDVSTQLHLKLKDHHQIPDYVESGSYMFINACKYYCEKEHSDNNIIAEQYKREFSYAVKSIMIFRMLLRTIGLSLTYTGGGWYCIHHVCEYRKLMTQKETEDTFAKFGLQSNFMDSIGSIYKESQARELTKGASLCDLDHAYRQIRYSAVTAM